MRAGPEPIFRPVLAGRVLEIFVRAQRVRRSPRVGGPSAGFRGVRVGSWIFDDRVLLHEIRDLELVTENRSFGYLRA